MVVCTGAAHARKAAKKPRLKGAPNIMAWVTKVPWAPRHKCKSKKAALHHHVSGLRGEHVDARAIPQAFMWWLSTFAASTGYKKQLPHQRAQDRTDQQQVMDTLCHCTTRIMNKRSAVRSMDKGLWLDAFLRVGARRHGARLNEHGVCEACVRTFCARAAANGWAPGSACTMNDPAWVQVCMAAALHMWACLLVGMRPRSREYRVRGKVLQTGTPVPPVPRRGKGCRVAAQLRVMARVLLYVCEGCKSHA